MTRYLLIVMLLMSFVVVRSQVKYTDDPMPAKERDRLPKPYILLKVRSDCFSSPQADSNFIIIGPNDNHICEVWLLKDWRKLCVIWERYNKRQRPLRAWIGQYTEFDFKNWRKFK